MAEKKKKEKIIYVDDGRTLADMSGVQSGAGKYFKAGPQYNGTFREKMGTFWAAFKMMLLPTAVFCGALLLIFVIMYAAFKWM